MTGEAWGHGVMKSDYYQNGFDAMINFDFQDQAAQALGCFADIDATYRQMAERLQDFNVLSYLSSHDTRLFFASDAKGSLPLQQRAANLLLLAPGAVQIYYGDESGRPLGPTGSDPLQGTRSDMNWRELLGKSPDAGPLATVGAVPRSPSGDRRRRANPAATRRLLRLQPPARRR